MTNIGPYGTLARVRFLNGKFVAVGTSSQILFSDDGTTWTPAILPGANFWDVAFGKGMYVVAGSTTYISNDRTNWAASTGPFDSVAFGNGRFVALPKGSGDMFIPTYYSTNGSDWVAVSAPTSYIGPGKRGEVIFGDGLFVADASEWNGVFVTTNGTAWCCGFGYPDDIYNGGLAYGQGYFIWASEGFANHIGYPWPFIYSSTNGISWDVRLGPSPPPTPNSPPPVSPALYGTSRGAAFGHDTFVVVGDGGYIIQSGNLGGVPLVILQPPDRAAVVDNPAVFPVQASGSQPLSYQWYYNNAVITNATNSTFTIAHVKIADSGGYKAVITNSFGSVTS